MILTVDSNRCINLPEGFAPGDRVLLISRQEGSYALLPINSATKEEIDQAMAGELEESAREFRTLLNKLGPR